MLLQGSPEISSQKHAVSFKHIIKMENKSKIPPKTDADVSFVILSYSNT
jgi:hypothetical protein